MREGILRISGVTNESIVDGPGYRYVIFTQGCAHHCPGCHNPQTHALDGGQEIEVSKILSQIVGNPLLKGVTFSGGEPFLQAKPLAELAALIHQYSLDVLVYSGYTYEVLTAQANDLNHWGQLLKESDYLIDGPFIQAQKTLDLPFRGSANQRMIDLNATGQTGQLVMIRRS